MSEDSEREGWRVSELTPDKYGKFGQFWYIRAIDRDGFDIHDERGIIHWRSTLEGAIIDCMGRYITWLENENHRLSNEPDNQEREPA